jgi:Leucine-rich repeat (LRR) protein
MTLLKQIFLQNNLLETLDKDAFKENTQLDVVYLYNQVNASALLQPELFASMSTTTVLMLQNMSLSHVDPQLFKKTSSLIELYLNNNYLTELDVGLFSECSKLKDLRLDSNQLTEVPSSLIASLTSLISLLLGDNLFTVLPENLLNNSPNLDTLTLSLNNLVDIPVNLFQNTRKLDTVLMYGMRLEHLDADLFKGLNLQWFSAINCNLTKLPPNLLEGMSKLNSIFLSYNPLGSLPPTLLHDAPMLELFALSNAKLTEIPVGFFQAQSLLLSISMNTNQIQHLDKDLFAACGLQLISVFFQDNLLTMIEDDLFATLTSLHVLDLSRNLLTSLSSKVFRHLSTLKELYLDYNLLIDLNFLTSGRNWYGLSALSVSQNVLSELKADWFVGTPNLQSLTMIQNQIRTVDRCFDQMDLLNVLSMDDNPTQCWRLDPLMYTKNPVICNCADRYIQTTEKWCQSVDTFLVPPKIASLRGVFAFSGETTLLTEQYDIASVDASFQWRGQLIYAPDDFSLLFNWKSNSTAVFLPFYDWHATGMDWGKMCKTWNCRTPYANMSDTTLRSLANDPDQAIHNDDIPWGSATIPFNYLALDGSVDTSFISVQLVYSAFVLRDKFDFDFPISIAFAAGGMNRKPRRLRILEDFTVERVHLGHLNRTDRSATAEDLLTVSGTVRPNLAIPTLITFQLVDSNCTASLTVEHTLSMLTGQPSTWEIVVGGG